MDHTDATATQATERYLLGELNAEEAGAFEEHYFDCRLCADDVRAGMAFFEGGRRLVREEREQERPVAPVTQLGEHPRWRRWIPAAAAAMFAYLTMVPLLMRTAPAVPKMALGLAAEAGDEVRGTADGGVVVTSGEPVLFNVPATADFPSYEVRLVDAAGKVLLTKTYSKDETLERQPYLAISGVQPGVYQLVIFGRGERSLAELDRVRITVRQ